MATKQMKLTTLTLTLPLWLIAALACLPYPTIEAADWPAFRGVNGDGKSDENRVPTEWSGEENVRWKVPLASAGNSSPIVSRGRVFLHTASDEGKKRGLRCFDRQSGQELWARLVEYDKIDETHKTNPYDGSTPAANGERVVVWHGSAGLYCYDFDGEEIWSRDFGRIVHFLGYASSPVIHNGRVILSVGPGVEQFVTAIDLETGKTIWQTNEPGGNAGQMPREVASFSTPVVVRVGDKDQIINNFPTRVVAYDPSDGQTLWTVGGMSGRQDLVYTSPIIAGDMGIAMAGFRGPRIGFRMDGAGDVTKTHCVWRIKQRNPQRIGTGVVVDGHVYTANVGPSTVECMDIKTGELKWQARTPGGDTWASVVYVAGHLYVTNQRGTTHVIRPNTETLEVVESNSLGETTNSSLAVSDGELIIRTHEHLYCISERGGQ